MLSEQKTKEVGSRIRSARIKRGLSLEQLAEKINISSGALSKIETNRVKKLDIFKAEEIALQLNVSIDYLMYGEGDDTNKALTEFTLQKESCSPTFEVGDVITVDKNATVKNMDYVAIERNDGPYREIDVRQFIEFDGEVLLKATNRAIPSEYSTRKKNDTDILIGKVIHTVRYF